MAKVIKNNKAYDSADLESFIEGAPFEWDSISYNSEQEHQVNHTTKAEADSWSMGKETHTCTATAKMHKLKELEKKAPEGKLYKLKPFTITNSFVNEFNEIVTDILQLKFTNQGREVTGDMGLSKEFTMLVLDIKYNV